MIVSMLSKECPIDITVRILANKWTIPIIKELIAGPKRPSDLERNLKGLSAKTLAERLHYLQAWGIIERHSYPEVPPRVEYYLSSLGHSLEPVFASLADYGKLWKESSKAPVQVAQTEHSECTSDFPQDEVKLFAVNS